MAGGGRESLWALELLVEWVRVAPRLLPPRGCLRPAVALRLLDFPALLVPPPEPGRPPRGPLFPFGRGKSCLFRLAPGPLRRAPLRALLLELPQAPGPARLLGSCCVSLGPLLDCCGRRGRYALRDPAGEPVGELALGYRLSNLGPALLRHLPAGLRQEQGLAVPGPTSPGDTQRRREPGSGHSKPSLSVGSQTEPQGGRASEPQPERSRQESVASQTHALEEEELRELEIEANVICPPPLYYSHLPAESPPSRAPGTVESARTRAPGTVASARMRAPQAQEQHPRPSADLPPRDACSDGGLAADSLAQSLVGPQQLRNALRELPLINALLIELSLLNSQPLPLGPSAVHPQLAWLYREVEKDVELSSPLTKSRGPSRKDKEILCNPSEKFKRSLQEFSKSASSLHESGADKRIKKAAVLRNGGFEKNSGSKENKPARKKLFYGLTNTLRLRLQQTNPEMLILHERREEYRKNQIEMRREKKGKGSSSKGKLLSTAEEHQMSYRHPVRRGSWEQNTQFGENIETLMQSSIEKDDSTTIKKDLEKHAVCSRVNNHENAKDDSLHKVNTDSSLEGTRIKTAYKEKGVTIHMPRAFKLDSDAKRNKVDDRGKNDYNASTLGDYKPSPNSFESNLELRYSDDFGGSPENTGYSEDFTSADYSGGGSGTLDSSPESALVNPKQACSDMESESKKSRLSEKSLRPESISAPLPVPSTASPVHSLKRNYDLKAQKQSTGAAVSMSISDFSPPASSLDEQELVPLVKDDNSKIDQNIVQASEAMSKQTNSDKNCSVVKGQTSLEKSQSLRTSQVSSYLPSNMSDLELSGVEESTSDEEEEDDFGTLSIPNQYKHISELVVNKLPGYTM